MITNNFLWIAPFANYFIFRGNLFSWIHQNWYYFDNFLCWYCRERYSSKESTNNRLIQ